MLKPYASELLSTLQQAMATDNEENALLCMRAVFDLYKGCRPPAEELQSLCDLVRRVSGSASSSQTLLLRCIVCITMLRVTLIAGFLSEMHWSLSCCASLSTLFKQEILADCSVVPCAAPSASTK